MRWTRPFRSAGLDTRFGFAVVGLGHGAHKFLEALASSPTVRVSALVSSNLEKAGRLARTWRVPVAATYAQLDTVLADAAIHAVYLCLPNALHREFAERAAAAGKHILCEKPMAPTPAECRAMIDACHRANRLLMIAYRPDFSAVHLRAREILAGGSLGRVQSIRSGFGFQAKPGWRLDPSLSGGGSLFDVGIYSAHALSTLLEEPFTLTTAHITRDPQTNLELSADWEATLASGTNIDCRASYVEKIPDHFEVTTERATLRIEPAFSYSGLRLRIRAHSPADRTLNLDLRTPRTEPSLFRLEAEHLAHCARTGAPLHTPGETGLRDIELLTQIEALAAR